MLAYLRVDTVTPVLVQVLSKRGGVPQYTQPHALLLSGLRAMEALFPGFSDELVAAGAQRIDWLQEMHSVRSGSHVQQSYGYFQLVLLQLSGMFAQPDGRA